eukprot:CAMPEP_0177559516 /NCGR_PEP_ID=MMETSP0369-20130122/70880_1 /TAXON_ID=447022 ORGANISM="Scrippsiella hangoei-like, Strain SHHI-4" /NCGR_SAMPLE_ID=MMETSP0369 /ASSEMBLY_ACC=CAM_ASM_000364 /LENGTH=451 /DNA_ID=CAMNT_0019046255 /DNA_START=60 /DNA_END=1411 /DNA_ORIENTATION=-
MSPSSGHPQPVGIPPDVPEDGAKDGPVLSGTLVHYDWTGLLDFAWGIVEDSTGARHFFAAHKHLAEGALASGWQSGQALEFRGLLAGADAAACSWAYGVRKAGSLSRLRRLGIRASIGSSAGATASSMPQPEASTSSSSSTAQPRPATEASTSSETASSSSRAPLRPTSEAEGMRAAGTSAAASGTGSSSLSGTGSSSASVASVSTPGAALPPKRFRRWIALGPRIKDPAAVEIVEPANSGAAPAPSSPSSSPSSSSVSDEELVAGSAGPRRAKQPRLAVDDEISLAALATAAALGCRSPPAPAAPAKASGALGGRAEAPLAETSGGSASSSAPPRASSPSGKRAADEAPAASAPDVGDAGKRPRRRPVPICFDNNPSLLEVVRSLLSADADATAWNEALHEFFATPLRALLPGELAAVSRAFEEAWRLIGPSAAAVSARPVMQWTGVTFG